MAPQIYLPSEEDALISNRDINIHLGNFRNLEVGFRDQPIMYGRVVFNPHQTNIKECICLPKVDPNDKEEGKEEEEKEEKKEKKEKKEEEKDERKKYQAKCCWKSIFQLDLQLTSFLPSPSSSSSSQLFSSNEVYVTPGVCLCSFSLKTDQKNEK